MTKRANVWTAKLEAAREEGRIEERVRLMNERSVEQFANLLGQRLMIVLGPRPYEQWPEIAKDVFTRTVHMNRNGAHYYKLRLPKTEEEAG